MDYGAGNLPSVERALARLGATCERVTSGAALGEAGVAGGAAAIVLPGVGHFGTLAHALDEHGLRAPLAAAIGRGVPLLGICLGMQALWAGSDEAPDERGLGLLAGRVTSLPPTVKLPHMGWNVLEAGERPGRLLAGIPAGARFYFAHSYAGPAQEEGVTVAVCDYGVRFAAAVERGNLFGVQFHPEKSGAPGAAVLANFLAAAGSGAAA